MQDGNNYNIDNILNENMSAILGYFKSFKSNIAAYADSKIDNSTFIDYSIQIHIKFMRQFVMQLNDTMGSFKKAVDYQFSKNANIVEYVRENKDNFYNTDLMISSVGYKYTLGKNLNFTLYDISKKLVLSLTNDKSDYRELFFETSNNMKNNYFDLVRGSCVGLKSPINANRFDPEIRKYLRNSKSQPSNILLSNDDIDSIISDITNPSSLCNYLDSDIIKLKTQCIMVIESMEKINRIKSSQQISLPNKYEQDEELEYLNRYIKSKYTQMINICGIYMYALSVKAQIILEKLKQDFAVVDYVMTTNERGQEA